MRFVFNNFSLVFLTVARRIIINYQTVIRMTEGNLWLWLWKSYRCNGFCSE